MPVAEIDFPFLPVIQSTPVVPGDLPGLIARERSSPMKRIIILAAILSVVALVAACKKSQPEPQTPA
jgi:hypothetical protein